MHLSSHPFLPVATTTSRYYRYLHNHPRRAATARPCSITLPQLASAQAISAAFYYRSDWPCLVLCPASLSLNWRAELTRWLHAECGAISPHDVHLVASGKDKDVIYDGAEGGVTIMSYDLALRMSEVAV